MKIAFFELEKARQDVFRKSLGGADISFFDEKLDETNVDLAKEAEVVSVFIGSQINKRVIDSLPNLKYINTSSTGFNHIDAPYAATKGIKVSNVPAYGSHTVAEFTFGLILNLSRNIIKANNSLRETSHFSYSSEMEGFDLVGKTLGIIGTGKIGKNVAKIAKGFGMNVLAYDLYPDLVFSKENNFTYKSLQDVVSESDIITLHTPYTKENHHLINKKNISLMKRGVYLINTARGELVDPEALVFGLSEGIIAGAGLDVLEGEKELKGASQALIHMPNVIVTPHVAFYTREAVAEIQKITIENIQGFISGSPINLVK